MEGRARSPQPCPPAHALFEEREAAACCHVHPDSDPSRKTLPVLLSFASIASLGTDAGCAGRGDAAACRKGRQADPSPSLTQGWAVRAQAHYHVARLGDKVPGKGHMWHGPSCKAAVLRGQGRPHPHGMRCGGRSPRRAAEANATRGLTRGHSGSQRFLFICLTVTRHRHDSPVSLGFENMRRSCALTSYFPLTAAFRSGVLEPVRPKTKAGTAVLTRGPSQSPTGHAMLFFLKCPEYWQGAGTHHTGPAGDPGPSVGPVGDVENPLVAGGAQLIPRNGFRLIITDTCMGVSHRHLHMTKAGEHLQPVEI